MHYLAKDWRTFLEAVLEEEIDSRARWYRYDVDRGKLIDQLSRRLEGRVDEAVVWFDPGDGITGNSVETAMRKLGLSPVKGAGDPLRTLDATISMTDRWEDRVLQCSRDLKGPTTSEELRGYEGDDPLIAELAICLRMVERVSQGLTNVRNDAAKEGR